MNDLMILSETDMRNCLADPAEVLRAVEDGVRAHARGDAQAYPTVAMQTESMPGGIYTIRGIVESAGLASVKTVGSYPDNRALGLPSDPGLLTLVDIKTGVPKLIAAASYLTTLRTAAMTAVGALRLAKTGARSIGCIGARGIAPLAARMIADHLEGATIKIHSRSEETRRDTVKDMQDLGYHAEQADSWDACIAGADIVIDGAGLAQDAALLHGSLIAKGALVISYGARCSFDDEVLPNIDRIIVDRWDPAASGALGRLIASGEMTQARIDAYFGNVVLGESIGRQSDDERILFWHRGLGGCDIALAAYAYSHANIVELGTTAKI